MLYGFLIVGLFSNFYSLYCYEEKELDASQQKKIEKLEAIYDNYILKRQVSKISKGKYTPLRSPPQKSLSEALRDESIVRMVIDLAKKFPVRLALISQKIGVAEDSSLLYIVFNELIKKYMGQKGQTYKKATVKEAQNVAISLSLVIKTPAGSIWKQFAMEERVFQTADKAMKEYYQKLLKGNANPFSPEALHPEIEKETRNSSSYILQVLNRYKIPVVLFLVAAPVMYYHRGALGEYLRTLWKAILAGNWSAVDRFKRAASWLQMRRGNKT